MNKKEIKHSLSMGEVSSCMGPDKGQDISIVVSLTVELSLSFLLSFKGLNININTIEFML